MHWIKMNHLKTAAVAAGFALLRGLRHPPPPLPAAASAAAAPAAGRGGAPSADPPAGATWRWIFR